MFELTADREKQLVEIAKAMICHDEDACLSIKWWAAEPIAPFTRKKCAYDEARPETYRHNDPYPGIEKANTVQLIQHK